MIIVTPHKLFPFYQYGDWGEREMNSGFLIFNFSFAPCPSEN